MKPLTIGSLFSGIGGLELGLERSGVGHVVWQCEIDAFCRAVLAKHWPYVERFEDVTQERVWPECDLLCGGFPCQDVSAAGRGEGLSGARSGLWFSFARVIEQVRPRVVVVENVASGKRRWLPAVRRHLHLLGYRTRAVALSAHDVGAPHLRRRIFVVAYALGESLRDEPGRSGGENRQSAAFTPDDGGKESLAHADSDWQQPRGSLGEVGGRFGNGGEDALGDAVLDGRSRAEGRSNERGEESPTGGWWTPEPAVGRVVDGVSGGLVGRNRRAALRALGNAVVPQCAEVVGKMILEDLEESA